jgi:hypothetical protein
MTKKENNITISFMLVRQLNRLLDQVEWW